MFGDIKVWAQMFFGDGSVSQGKYTNCEIYDNQEDIETIATEFLEDMNRISGILLIWGCDKIYVRKAILEIVEGSQIIRLETV